MTRVTMTGAALVALLAAAGCSRSVSPFESSGPAPLTPAPTGQVAANQLPPPPPPPPPPSTTTNDLAQNQTGTDGTMPTDQADAGTGNTNGSNSGTGTNGSNSSQSSGGGTQVASLDSKPLSRASVSGFYKLSTTGGNCQIGLAYTKWAGGYRAASRGCPGKIADVTAWDVSGSQVVLKDSGGATVANLSSAGGSKYTGRTAGGQEVTIYR
ncbi:AprI/Inh family metalloprotease inhibitor [Aurantimonas sp. VKM B-3413]|uniref:AprI/Inh family metalloprotease inhibitor n=1 Tax=Aurantimonas sp. VKM B-3413 TaxID=2779401 RepID=UPI001E578E53|nr:AprI/Inh family metalloprotease inhibitor [Aurantimonas sp. VKM B-3413]MCB8840679.1 protease inhibitor Inh/omp19 family protein [Aurantimonas sp. VKM B-3413]